MTLSSRQEVSAVIINYGSRRDTAELAGKLESQVRNILIVDNSNEIDGTDPAFRGTEVITPMENLGFGAAVNLAARQIDTRWLLVLNPDVRLRRNCLKYLLEASSQLHAPLCGPRFYWDDACKFELPPALGHPLWLLSDRNIHDQHLAESADLTALALARHKRFWSEASPFSEPVLSGACLLVDNQWFTQNKMPVFDEDFFLYYEDTDLCGRLMRKGVMPICVANAYAVHYWNQSSEPPAGKAELMRASEKIFLKKYYPNGAPALPARQVVPEIAELGSFTSPPALILPRDTTFLDVGAQDDFIVFARTAVSQPAFGFSREMWRRIRPGDYYFRALSAAGKTLALWHWRKQE